MRSAMLGAACLCLLATACGASPAQLGSLYADAYAAFAPLYLLYRSYADHLFSGSAVGIPADLETSCERFSYRLAVFHVDYVQQSDSATASGLGYVVRLRMESSAFCDTYDGRLRALAASDGSDADLLGAASEEGLFAATKRLHDLWGDALDEILASLGDGIERWAFAVTFSVRALLQQPEVDRIDESIRAILYGDPDGANPPFGVPQEITDAMELLVALSGRGLSEGEVEDAYRAAAAIYEHFLVAP